MKLVAVLVVAVVLTAAACGDDDEAGETTSTPTTVTAATTDTTTTAPPTTTTTAPPITTTTAPPTTTSQPTTTTSVIPEIDWVFAESDQIPVVRLIDPGQEPHQVWEYELEQGTVSVGLMSQTMSIQQTVEGVQAVDFDLRVVTETTTEVVGMTDDGFAVEFTYGTTNVEADPAEVLPLLEATFSELVGRSVYVLVSPRGEALAVATRDLPDDVAEFAELGMQATQPLPSEPFGLDAEWEVDTLLEIEGTVFQQTSRVRVIDIDGSRLTVSATVSQELGPEGFVLPGVETVSVDYVTSGSGEVVIDVTDPFPAWSRSSVDQELVAVVDASGEQATVNHVMSMTVEMGTEPFD